MTTVTTAQTENEIPFDLGKPLNYDGKTPTLLPTMLGFDCNLVTVYDSDITKLEAARNHPQLDELRLEDKEAHFVCHPDHLKEFVEECIDIYDEVLVLGVEDISQITNPLAQQPTC